MDYMILPIGKIAIDWDGEERYLKVLQDGSIIKLNNEEKE